MDRKRITANGIHHLVEGATDDKDPKIKDVLYIEGFGVLELIDKGVPTQHYAVLLSNLNGMKTYTGQLPAGQNFQEIGIVAVMQHCLESQQRYIARAVFSTSADGNPQLSGNMYKDK